MSMRRSMLRALGATAAMVLATPVAQAAFWTTPDPVVAGQPTRVVYTTSSRGGQPSVEVQMQGNQIVLMQGNPCADACFATWVPATTEATLPPLAPGTYTVTVAWKDDDLPPGEVATLDVQAGPVVQVLPADGFWSPVGQPGSGLFLERRADLLAVSMYSYTAGSGQPTWLLGSGTYAGDSVPLLMGAYLGGDCLGCAEYRAPTGPMGTAALQLRFESARRAWLDLPYAASAGGATTLPVTSLPYGVDYIAHTLTDSVDAEFGPLPLPDLGGRWLFSIEDADAPAVALEVTIGEWSLQGEVLHWTSNVQLTCRSADAGQRAGCTFNPNIAFSPPLGAPLDTFYSGGFFVPLGDIQEDRMRGVFEDGGRTWRVRGFRTAW